MYEKDASLGLLELGLEPVIHQRPGTEASL